MKETEGDTDRWKDTPCSWMRRTGIVKVTTTRLWKYWFSTVTSATGLPAYVACGFLVSLVPSSPRQLLFFPVLVV